MIRRLLCHLRLHAWFRQLDRWGSADVCRYCVAVREPTRCGEAS